MDNETNSMKEYEVANENLRSFANLGVAEVTIFIAINGGLLAALFSLDLTKHEDAPKYLKLLGCVTSVCFSIIMLSTRYVYFHFVKRATALEEKLHIELWSTMYGGPKKPIPFLHKVFPRWIFPVRPNLWASWIICIGVLIFWIWALCLGKAF